MNGRHSIAYADRCTGGRRAEPSKHIAAKACLVAIKLQNGNSRASVKCICLYERDCTRERQLTQALAISECINSDDLNTFRQTEILQFFAVGKGIAADLGNAGLRQQHAFER